jgi:hypothetical protein
MRRLLGPTMLAIALLVVFGALADDVVLKDGRVLKTVGPPVLKGRMAILKTVDGQLLSVPVEEIDQQKTAAARVAPTPTPAPTATPNRPLTPAEASRSKSGRKATVVLTDDQVAGGGLPADDAEKKESGEERVDVANASATKTKGGYAIAGSVVNSGKVDVSGVGVTIEAIGQDNKTLVSGFGQIAKDDLAPGEKSAFTATLSTDAEALSFRYVPQWQVKMGVKGAAGEGGTGGRSAAAGAGDAKGIVPTPTPGVASSQVGEKADKLPGDKAPAPPPTPLPRPDIAPQSPNAPIGAPDKPGGTFLPKPTGDQPKPPSGN